MVYKTMRFKKYINALKTNRPFFMALFPQKKRILLNILKYFYYNKKLIIKNKPVTAQIEPTSNCNLKCSMCIRDKIGVPIGTMSFKDFKKILDKLDCLFKIHLSGQGEPFLNKDIFKMIKYANDRGILVNLNTNGTLLTKEIIDNICKVEIGEIAVSIESTNKKDYEKIRKGANFENVMNNIKNLNRKLKEKKKNTIISFAVTILKRNIKEITDFVKHASETGVRKLVIQTIQEKDDYIQKYNSDAKSQTTSKFNKEIKEKIKEAEKTANKYNIALIFDEEKSNGCIWPWRGVYVTWNGNVTVCCKILDYRKPIMGDILKEGFWKIWNGKQYQLFRRLLRERNAPPPCKGCNMA